MTGDLPAVLRRGTKADLDSLEPLWVGVHHRHAEAMPELAPYVDDPESWAVRRELYAELLGKDGTVLLLASVGTALVGYGLAHVMNTGDTWIPDTWRTGSPIGEIESLAVTPAYRGRGIGARLLTELERALRDAGIQDLILGVLPGNDSAIRLYERHGYRPTWLYLSKWEGR